MSSQCPSCNTVIDDEFGLVKCPGCGVICYIDLDGNVSLQEDELQNYDASAENEEITGSYNLSSVDSEVEDEHVVLGDTPSEEDNLWQTTTETTDDDLNGALISEVATSSYAEEASEESLEGGAYDLSSEEESNSEESTYGDSDLELDSESHPNSVSDYGSDGEFSEENLEEESWEANATELEEVEDNFEDDGLQDLDSEDTDLESTNPDGLTLGSESDVESLENLAGEDLGGSSTSTPPMSVDDFLNEIEVFGAMNSEPFQESAFFFDITISGIDSKDIRAEILEILSDSKFRLEDEDFSRKIVDGKLQIFQMPAVKAAVLIQNLAHLNCDLDWKLKEAQDLSYEDSEIPEGNYSEEPMEDPGVVEESDSFDDLIDSYDDVETVDEGEYESDYDSGS